MWPSASKIHGAVSAISTGPYNVTGQPSRQLAVDDDGLAVDDGGFDALAPRLEATDATGQVVHELLLPRPNGLGVEDHDVGPPARFERPAVGQAEQSSRELGDLV